MQIRCCAGSYQQFFFTSRGHTIWGNIVCGFLRYDVVGIQHGWSFENLDYYFDACLK